MQFEIKKAFMKYWKIKQNVMEKCWFLERNVHAGEVKKPGRILT